METLIVSQDIPGNMAPEQVEQFSDVARAAVAVRAASGKPVIVVSNISGGIDPAIGDILAQGNVPVVQGSGVGIPAIRRWIDWCAARGENGISLPPEGFPHSFHTPPNWLRNSTPVRAYCPTRFPPACCAISGSP